MPFPYLKTLIGLARDVTITRLIVGKRHCRVLKQHCE